jgi:hypothetical protein
MSTSSFQRTLGLCCGLLWCGLLVVGCSMSRTTVASMSDIGSDEAVLVGRIELVPPLQQGEQRLEGLFVGDLRNRAYFLTDDHWREVQGTPSMFDYRGNIGEEFSKTFSLAVPTKPLYLLKGIMHLHLTKNRWEQAWLPAGLKVDVHPGDRAVYMGTVRYHRNEFMDITKVEIVDDFARETGEFSKKFGGKTVLRKRLATVIKVK